MRPWASVEHGRALCDSDVVEHEDRRRASPAFYRSASCDAASLRHIVIASSRRVRTRAAANARSRYCYHARRSRRLHVGRGRRPMAANRREPECNRFVVICWRSLLAACDMPPGARTDDQAWRAQQLQAVSGVPRSLSRRGWSSRSTRSTRRAACSAARSRSCHATTTALRAMRCASPRSC